MIIAGADAFVNAGRAVEVREFLAKIRPKTLSPAKTGPSGKSGVCFACKIWYNTFEQVYRVGLPRRTELIVYHDTGVVSYGYQRDPAGH